jgi:O-antigen/teichoic acid export membrane protein
VTSKVSKTTPSLTIQAFWLMTARVAAFAFAFVIPVLLARLLSQEEFGLYKQTFLIIATAQSILPLGFGMGAFYFLPREPQRRGAVVFHVLLFNAIVGLAAFVALQFDPNLLVLILGSSELAPCSSLIGLVIFLWIFSGFLEIVATAHQDVKASTVFIVTAQLTKSAFMVVATLWSASIRALLYAVVLQGIVQSVMLLAYLELRFPKYWSRFDGRLFRMQLSYGMPLGLAGLVYTMQTDLHKYIVAHFFSASAYAIYAIGCSQVPLIALLRTSVASVMIPTVSYLQQQGQHEEILLLTMRAMRKLCAFYWPVYFFLMVMGREFLTVLFTDRYIGSWPIFAINLTLIPVALLMIDPVLRAYAEYRHWLLMVRIISLVVLVGAVWIGVAKYGMVGAIGAVVLIIVLERIVLVWRVIRTLGMRIHHLPLLADVLKLAAAAMLAAVLTGLVRSFVIGKQPLAVLTLCGLVFSAVYGATAWGFGVVTPEEKQWLQRKLAQVRKGGSLQSEI